MDGDSGNHNGSNYDYYSEYEPDPAPEFDNITDHATSTPSNEHLMKIIAILLYTTTFVLGVCGNGLVIWMTGFKMKRTVNTTWFLSLAVADFIFCVFIPFSIVHAAYDFHWHFGLVMCKMNSFIMCLNMFASVFILTIISIDRCLSVVLPVWSQNNRTARRAGGLVVAAWLASALLSTPSLVLRDIHVENEKIICFNNYKLTADTSQAVNKYHKAVVFTRFFFGFLLPVIVIVICYGIIVRNLKKNRLARSSKPFKIIASIIITFFICWVPYHVFNILELNHREIPHSVLHHGIPIATGLLTANSFLNPVLYVFMGKDFKNTFKLSVLSRLENALCEDTCTTSKHNSGMRSELERSSTAI
ncbi:UNVERIFIED_CONTAM: hypothetical protein FKN15_060884 [Acipenser sinensis]